MLPVIYSNTNHKRELVYINARYYDCCMSHRLWYKALCCWTSAIL